MLDDGPAHLYPQLLLHHVTSSVTPRDVPHPITARHVTPTTGTAAWVRPHHCAEPTIRPPVLTKDQSKTGGEKYSRQGKKRGSFARDSPAPSPSSLRVPRRPSVRPTSAVVSVGGRAWKPGTLVRMWPGRQTSTGYERVHLETVHLGWVRGDVACVVLVLLFFLLSSPR